MSFPKEKDIYETVGETVGERGAKIIEFLRKEPTITRDELAKKLNISVRGVEYHLSKLKTLDLISREGSTKKGRWIVN